MLATLGAPVPQEMVDGIIANLDSLRMTKKSPVAAQIAAAFLAADGAGAITGTWINATAGMFPSRSWQRRAAQNHASTHERAPLHAPSHAWFGYGYGHQLTNPVFLGGSGPGVAGNQSLNRRVGVIADGGCG